MTKRAEPNPDWQARMDTVCQPENFQVYIQVATTLPMTDKEHARLTRKLTLVQRYAQHMAMNMAKGTIKYPTDDYDLDTWLVEEADDDVDATNYRLLRLDAMRSAGLI